MKNDTYNDIYKEAFEHDGLSAPESLSEEAVFAMLENVPQEPVSESPAADGSRRMTGAPRRKWMRPAIAVAACLLLVFSIGTLHPFGPADPQGGTLTGSNTDPDTTDPAVLFADAQTDEYGLTQPASYEELDELVASLVPEDIYATGDIDMEVAQNDAPATAKGSSDIAAGSDYDLATEAGTPASSGTQHSSTYTQVEGIDEADIIKTDGKYIYFVSDFDNSIVIVSAKDGKTKRVSSVSGTKCGTYIYDLYVTGDRLIVLGDKDSGTYSPLHPFDRAAAVVTVFDISDRSNPEQLTQYEQSGYILSSRLHGNTLYLVTNDYIYTYEKDHCCPCIAKNGGTFQPIAIGDIRCFPEAASPSFTVVGAMDITKKADDKDSVSTKAVLGGSEQIYCSSEALYITTSFYPGDFVSHYQGADDSMKTRILKMDLTGAAPRCTGTAIVDGTVNDQFSMDDGNHLFKIATTSWKNGQDVNNLYLFDEQMQLTGSLRNFAKDEHIEAARYIKDKAYVITYEQTDPLFIIDLSDPADPRIEGHVKISGFSTLLVPTSDDELLGIGFSTDTTEWGEATDGLKLALFDIHDAADPKVSDSMAFENMESQVQYDHRALLVGPEAGWYALPYEIWNFDELSENYETEAGILVFSVKNGKLQVKEQFRTDGSVHRALFIDSWIYGVCEDDTIESFRIK